MNTLIKMFSLCLCLSTLAFASSEVRLSDNNNIEVRSIADTYKVTNDTRDCEDCEFDWTNYGSECCDTAWDEYGIDCATLESNYGWDCAGCLCPGDIPCEDQGLIECWDGSCAASEADCPEFGTCPDGQVVDCDGTGECWPESWIGDGFADCNDQAYGADLTCYDCDGGDCPASDPGCPSCEDTGQITCWDGSCADSAGDCPDEPVIETPGICAEGVDFNGYNAVTVTWSIETVCGDGVCNGDEDYYNCPEDCNAPGECEDGYVPDCADDDCCPESWIGDGFEDCEDQAYGCDLTCYDNDAGDCDGSSTGGTTGGTTGGGSETCEDCEFDWTNYGSECCDTAWDEYGIDCATLESNYGWDCAGCSCPGDAAAECGDGNCTGDETYENCPADCSEPTSCEEAGGNQSWVGDGWCDTANNNEGCGYDGGDCCPDDCVELVDAGCPEAGSCYAGDGVYDYCGDCTVCIDPSSDDCVDTADTGEETYAASTANAFNGTKGVKSIDILTDEQREGAPYSRTESTSVARIGGGYDSSSSRLLELNLNFSCEACLQGEAYSGDWPADPALGEFTLYGFDDFSVVLVTAQACDGGACGDLVGPVVASAGAGDGVQDCAEGAGGNPCDGTVAGDVTLDGEVNVLDIVNIVNHVLESELITEECALGAADYTADGEVNVLDIVQIVNVILEGRITGDASSAVLKNTNGNLTLDANGYIGGVQMTLSHGPDFSIEMTDKAMVADYNTVGNTTKLVVVAPESNELFSSSGSFTFENVIVANSTSEVSVGLPSKIEILGAYPNPFNPSTTISFSVDKNSAVNIMAYDIAGRMVDVVFDGTVNAGVSNIAWNASSLSSGVYFVKLNTPDGSSSMQKVMLMK